MSSYITSTSLTTTLGSYLTTSTAASTYAPKASPTFTGTVAGITATMVGLANVNNTSDANKPISTATQTALDLKAPLASPAFTGVPTSVTQATSDNSTRIATTAYVQNNIANMPTIKLQFYCSTSGSLTISSTGVYTVTLASYTTGTYAFTFSGNVGGYPMIQCFSASASVNYNANLTSWTGSACTVVIKDSSNALQNAAFWFTVV